MARLPQTAPHRSLNGAGRERLSVSGAPTRGGVALWMGLAFGVELFIAASVLIAQGIGGDSIDLALRLTARVAFPLFWLAYVGGALATLFGPYFEPLGRQVRLFGLAFAAAMTVHFSLVATLCAIGAVPAANVFAIFGTAAICTYALALFSVPRLREALGRRGWKVLSFVAMNYVGLAFLDDFKTDVFADGIRHGLFYGPFLALTIAAPALRFAAFLHGRWMKLVTH